MSHVDALSRNSVEPPKELNDVTMYSIAVYEDEILLYQRSNENYANKIRILEKNVVDRTRCEKRVIKD